jgi:hypothetical protein
MHVAVALHSQVAACQCALVNWVPLLAITITHCARSWCMSQILPLMARGHSVATMHPAQHREHEIIPFLVSTNVRASQDMLMSFIWFVTPGTFVWVHSIGGDLGCLAPGIQPSMDALACLNPLQGTKRQEWRCQCLLVEIIFHVWFTQSCLSWRYLWCLCPCMSSLILWSTMWSDLHSSHLDTHSIWVWKSTILNQLNIAWIQ